MDISKAAFKFFFSFYFLLVCSELPSFSRRKYIHGCNIELLQLSQWYLCKLHVGGNLLPRAPLTSWEWSCYMLSKREALPMCNISLGFLKNEDKTWCLSIICSIWALFPGSVLMVDKTHRITPAFLYGMAFLAPGSHNFIQGCMK